MIKRTRAACLSLGVALLVFALAASTACRREEAASVQRTDQKQVATRTVAVPVDGMICQVCAGSVKSALKAVHGVQDVEVSLEKRNAIIHYEEGKVGLDQLRHVVADLGYKAGVPMPIRPQ